MVPFIQLLKHWWCDMQSGIVMEKNWALSVDQCWLQDLQFLVHLIDLLSIIRRCNGFVGIQKAVVDQTGSRPPKSDPTAPGQPTGHGTILQSAHEHPSFAHASPSAQSALPHFFTRTPTHTSRTTSSETPSAKAPREAFAHFSMPSQY